MMCSVEEEDGYLLRVGHVDICSLYPVRDGDSRI